jgi:hypothetical protein
LLNQTQVLTFLSQNLYQGYSENVKFQNSESFLWFLEPNIVTENSIRNGLNQTQRLVFLSRNLYERYPEDSEFQNFEYEVHQNGFKDSESQNQLSSF